MNDTGKIQLNDMLEKARGNQGMLIPVLQKAQEIYGYLPRETIEYISQSLKIPVATVYGVITFYAQFRLNPMGRNIIRVCQGTACHVRGGAKVREGIERALGIKDGETTPDLRYTLESVACVGACGLAPVMSVNNEVHGRLTPDRAIEILADYQ